ncbi:hypothetical protein [Polyangium jinanense]|uniref:Uncharacterized protein n=1 Tax=Polyangium jinanense TaxID=2829994 RepID=A0A9X4AVM5_9BACT|nr:hypothetical protein [Polyangium jinanense]MDC3960906.1 hypothetical protein [Polyangium jinanense]MDC3984487.1 hypothetical protein [Polyangium jinanense]
MTNSSRHQEIPSSIPLEIIITPDVAFEKVFSSTAARKLGELQRDLTPVVQEKLPEFWQQVGVSLSSQSGFTALYDAMSATASAFDGLGSAPPPAPFSTLHHVSGAQTFYQYNVRLSWKVATAILLGLDPSKVNYDSPDTPVYASWIAAITNGSEIPAQMLEPSSAAAELYGWWSPDARMDRPSSSSFEQGNDDFSAMCQIVSLAPEWYPYGLVRFNIPDATSVQVVRPSPYDGLTSPLWVQRPPTQPARTGGAALETLLGTTMTLGQLGPVQAYIVTPQTTQAILQAASVVYYAEDLALVKWGDTAESRFVAGLQVLVTEQCRAARAIADHAFAELILKDPMKKDDAVSGANAGSAAPSAPPASLAEEMERWARLGMREHRGQRFPSDRFSEEVHRTSNAVAIHQAATDLLRRSDHPDVLRMIVNIANVSTHRPFFDALLERLEGRGVPDGPGQRSGTLAGDALQRLVEGLPAGDQALAQRVHAVLERAGRSDLRLLALSSGALTDEVESLFQRVGAQPGADANLLGLAAVQMARQRPDRLLAIIAAARGQDEPTRRRITAMVQQAEGGWFAQHGAALEQALGLSP